MPPSHSFKQLAAGFLRLEGSSVELDVDGYFRLVQAWSLTSSWRGSTCALWGRLADTLPSSWSSSIVSQLQFMEAAVSLCGSLWHTGQRWLMWWHWRSSFSAWLPWHLPRNYAAVKWRRGKNKCTSVCIPRSYEASHLSITWGASVSHRPLSSESVTFQIIFTHLNFHTDSLPLSTFSFFFSVLVLFSSPPVLISVMPASWVTGPESIPQRPLRKTSRGRRREGKRRNMERKGKSGKKWGRQSIGDGRKVERKFFSQGRLRLSFTHTGCADSHIQPWHLIWGFKDLCCRHESWNSTKSIQIKVKYSA